MKFFRCASPARFWGLKEGGNYDILTSMGDGAMIIEDKKA
jgi:hypothetical protein